MSNMSGYAATPSRAVTPARSTTPGRPMTPGDLAPLALARVEPREPRTQSTPDSRPRSVLRSPPATGSSYGQPGGYDIGLPPRGPRDYGHKSAQLGQEDALLLQSVLAQSRYLEERLRSVIERQDVFERHLAGLGGLPEGQAEGQRRLDEHERRLAELQALARGREPALAREGPAQPPQRAPAAGLDPARLAELLEALEGQAQAVADLDVLVRDELARGSELAEAAVAICAAELAPPSGSTNQLLERLAEQDRAIEQLQGVTSNLGRELSAGLRAAAVQARASPERCGARDGGPAALGGRRGGRDAAAAISSRRGCGPAAATASPSPPEGGGGGGAALAARVASLEGEVATAQRHLGQLAAAVRHLRDWAAAADDCLGTAVSEVHRRVAGGLVAVRQRARGLCPD